MVPVKQFRLKINVDTMVWGDYIILMESRG